MKPRSLALLLTVVLSSTLSAQLAKRSLTIDDIYDRAKRIPAAATDPKDFKWADDTHFYWARTSASGEVTGFALIDATTGAETVLFNPDELQAQVSKIEGVSGDEAKKLAHPRSITVDWGSHGVLLTIRGDLYIYDIGAKTLTQLTSRAGEETVPTFSPDGKLVAFVRDGNLFTIEVASKTEHQLTTDGSSTFLNGKLDWVYQEEIFGRDQFKAYWWSPDSRTIAFLKIDDSAVHEFTVVDHIPHEQTIENTRYPRPGEPNPVATLNVVDLAGSASRRVDQIADPSATLIVDVAWRPDSGAVTFQVQDREQTWLELREVSRAPGDGRVLLKETTKAWVDNQGSPFFLGDRSYLWLSERTGWKHIYRVAPDGTQRALTSGEWEVKKILGVDEKNRWIYFSGSERDPIGVDVYRMRLDGTGRQLLTQRAGTHDATFNDSLSRFVDAWSDLRTPTQISVSGTDGKNARVFYDANAGHELDGFDLATPELVHVPTRDGFIMEAILIRPPRFDATKSYPVYEHTYGGPHAPQVKNAWGGSTYLFHQLLAQKNIVVWICDNRSASGKGAQSAWPLYKNFGELEIRDLEDGLTWLGTKPGIDLSRVLLNGWSFGGFMTTYALTHSTKWSAGIGGGNVTDWSNYDSVYTERFMLTPEHNKDGYEKTSPLRAAANLHGSILLLHGAIDDNVHVQNTIQFAYALQKAGKQFEMMLYPKSRHGVTDTDLVKQMRTLMLGFVLRKLKP